MTVHTRVAEAHPEAVSDRPGVGETDPEEVKAHNGAVKAYLEIFEAHPGAVGDHILEQMRLTPAQLRLTMN